MIASGRGGRPKRGMKAGERVPMSFRVRPELKRQMDEAAEQTGCSVAQEIEMRLEDSFRDQTVICEALYRGYGPKLATVLLMIGRMTVNISSAAQ